VIQRIASVNPNTHVVLINGSPLEISDWLPSVASLTEAWYPGMEGGTAVAEALLGRINPSGRMPFTWAKRLDDYPCRRFAREDALNVLYTERLNVGYRYFDTADTAPLFPFGYGLSYTTFDYSGLTAAATPEGHGTLGSVRVSNTGSRDGWETVQIYVRPLNPSVERPAHELKFFRKLFIPAGAAADVDFCLDSDAFSVYDVTQGDWRLDPGKYAIEVCRDSRTPLLSTNIEIR